MRLPIPKSFRTLCFERTAFLAEIEIFDKPLKIGDPAVVQRYRLRYKSADGTLSVGCKMRTKHGDIIGGYTEVIHDSDDLFGFGHVEYPAERLLTVFDQLARIGNIKRRGKLVCGIGRKRNCHGDDV